MIKISSLYWKRTLPLLEVKICSVEPSVSTTEVSEFDEGDIQVKLESDMMVAETELSPKLQWVTPDEKPDPSTLTKVPPISFPTRGDAALTTGRPVYMKGSFGNASTPAIETDTFTPPALTAAGTVHITSVSETRSAIIL